MDESFRGPDFTMWLLEPCANVNVLTIEDINIFHALPGFPIAPDYPLMYLDLKRCHQV
jgi:hypothetical protein